MQTFVTFVFCLLHVHIYFLLINITLSQDCSNRCEWTPWNAWSLCSATCGGGYRERDRGLCCDVTLDVYECLAVCGRDVSGFVDVNYCGGTCYNGAPTVVYPDTCSCSDAFYGSCCENRISCAAPPPITNGAVTSRPNFYHGDTVTYWCNDGYNLTGGDWTRTCVRGGNGYGYWNGLTPRCAFVRSCDSDPCQNLATCMNGLDTYSCICGHGWSGQHCESDILPPSYDACPENITRYTASHTVTIEWTAPAFVDPHGESTVRIIAQNYPLPIATLPWGEYVMQYVAVKERNGLTAECKFTTSVYPFQCLPLSSPQNGSLACNGWNARFGAICTMFCPSRRDVPHDVKIEDVYVCGATGSWLPLFNDRSTCSESRSELTAGQQTPSRQKHYYDGQCSDSSTRLAIQEAYIDILIEHDMSYMCTADRFTADCKPKNVDILCD